MKFKKQILALCAAFLLLCSFGALTGCTDNSQTTPPQTTSDPNNDPAPDNNSVADSSVAEADAKKMVEEKLPEGYTAESKGDAEVAGKKYYIFAVTNPEGNDAGSVAIDKESGERYNYDGEKISEYADFPLYDAATDAECDWNGIWANGDVTVELMQADTRSFEFTFSDGTEDVARIQGNTAATADGTLTFTYQDDGNLLVGGENTALAGTYQKSSNE